MLLNQVKKTLDKIVTINILTAQMCIYCCTN